MCVTIFSHKLYAVLDADAMVEGAPAFSQHFLSIFSGSKPKPVIPNQPWLALVPLSSTQCMAHNFFEQAVSCTGCSCHGGGGTCVFSVFFSAFSQPFLRFLARALYITQKNEPEKTCQHNPTSDPVKHGLDIDQP